MSKNRILQRKSMGDVSQPLRWPEGQPRTRLNDRKGQSAWKKPYSQVVDYLESELTRLGATSWLVTHNESSSADSGVAVYFSLKPQTREEWQEALGFVGEVPTVADIDKAYRERAMKVHPDGPTPDRVVFDKLTEHRDRARAWARGQQAVEHEKVMAIDIFNEVRLNLNAVRMVIAALRQIERCGAPMMMERAFRGFHKQINATASPDSVGLEASRV
jgi:hypothetical protein